MMIKTKKRRGFGPRPKRGQSMKPKSRAQRLVVVALAVLVLASAGFLIYRQLHPAEASMSAIVAVGGVEVAVIDLSEDAEPYEIDLHAQFGVGVVLEVRGHEIHFKSSTCPDQICIHAGWLRRDLDIAVCMPNQVSVVVVPSADAPR